MWSRDLEKLAYFSPQTFVASDKDEERLIGFVLALALYYNDSKAILGLSVQLISDKPKFDRISEDFGEYSAVKNYIDRLTYAHIHELHYLMQSHFKMVKDLKLFKKVVNSIGKPERIKWDELVAMSTATDSVEKKWFKNFRDGLAFHYVRQDDLYEGYADWAKSITKGSLQEGAYVSLGKSIQRTRYYFADAAAASWMKKEWAALPNAEQTLKEILQRNGSAIMGFMLHFIIARGGKLKASTYPKFPVPDAKSEKTDA